jgi:hypothetical protein
MTDHSYNPFLREEQARPSADRMVDICLKRRPLPEHYTLVVEPTPMIKGIWQVDLPPDVPVLVVVYAERDRWRPSRYSHTVFVYRNPGDRARGLDHLRSVYGV